MAFRPAAAPVCAIGSRRPNVEAIVTPNSRNLGQGLLDAQAGDGPADDELLDLLGAFED
ncbi:MAG: hypothetical protein OES57_08430 [Acidimicrobiia bacterium]|nr:hypothetical protein [Acidimicrobiia bacterium]